MSSYSSCLSDRDVYYTGHGVKEQAGFWVKFVYGGHLITKVDYWWCCMNASELLSGFRKKQVPLGLAVPDLKVDHCLRLYLAATQFLGYDAISFGNIATAEGACKITTQVH